MSQQIINISTPDDGLGDVLRNGFDKTNQNFTELYNGKVDKVTGKGLSENDFTDPDKTKLDGIEAGAEVNVQADWGETDPLADSFIQNKPPALYSAFGYFHYADLDTQTTPLAFVSSTPLQLINDTLGAFTNENQAPYGISGVWDKPTDSLDFSQLSVGDAVFVRTDLLISTTSINQNLRLYIKLGIGTTSEYDLLIDSWNEKSIVTFEEFIKDVSFSIDNEDWRTAPAKIYILSDDDGSVKVNGWYIPIIRKSVNVIDFNSDPLKLNKVTTSGVERAYIINADGSQGTKATSEFGGGSVESVNGQTGDVILGFSDITTAQNLGEFIDGLDSKTDVKDTDEFILSDSDDGLKSKKTRFLDLKTKLKSYFDTFYLSLSVFNDFVTDVFDSLDNKLDKSTTASSVYGTNAGGVQTMIPLGNFGTVKGTGTTNRISKFTASGTIGDSQIFDNGTNVGIGVESTSARLDVKAQGALATDIAFRVRNSTDTKNFLVVNGAGDVYNNGAGGINTNTFFGENVCRNATGAYNSIFGNQAGRDLTTGAGNALFGYNAGRNITTQEGNTFIGSRAGESNIANNNTAVGSNSLLLNTTGANNTAIGNEALYYNTTGGTNTALGNGAGFNNTTGGRNIFLGTLSGRSNTTGQSNICIGVDSAFAQTTGNNNIFVGDGSGRFLADGVANLTISNNSLFLGRDTRANADNQTNQIVIGDSAIGLGSNSVVLGNTSITITQLRGQVIMGAFASAPTGIEGAIYYDSTTKKHYGFNGTTWNALY